MNKETEESFRTVLQFMIAVASQLDYIDLLPYITHLQKILDKEQEHG